MNRFSAPESYVDKHFHAFIFFPWALMNNRQKFVLLTGNAAETIKVRNYS